MNKNVSWSLLGRISYSDCLDIQNRLQNDIVSGKDCSYGHILMLEHEPVITVGKFGSNQNLLASQKVLKERGIELFETNRGGDFTYHGPGQLVCYPVLNLKELGLGVKKYVNLLEEVIIQSLSSLEIDAGRRDKYPGVWVDNSKIAFIGIYVKKHITMHGFSLNITKQDDAFSHIVPCGITDLQITSISEILKREVELKEIINIVKDNFENIFEIEFD